MNQSIIIALMLATTVCADKFDPIVDAIYVAEGGARAKVPYGILSVPVRDKADARRICHRTVENNFKRWTKAGCRGEFIDFLADRYCPPSIDNAGNKNWKRNVRVSLKIKS